MTIEALAPYAEIVGALVALMTLVYTVVFGAEPLRGKWIESFAKGTGIAALPRQAVLAGAAAALVLGLGSLLALSSAGTSIMTFIIVLAAISLVEGGLGRSAGAGKQPQESYLVLKALQRIVNSTSRGAMEITTVRAFLDKTDEKALVAGDEVIVLTNDLEGYDLKPEAVEVTGGNVIEGVKYVFLLPVAEASYLAKDAATLRRSIEAKYPGKTAMIDQNLVFRWVNIPVLYHFAIVRRERPAVTAGYWYVTAPPAQSASQPDLAISTLTRDHRNDLHRALNDLVKASGATPVS
jgi:hypothetical protein